MAEERILALFDTHIPHQINLDPVFEFAEDFKPTIVVLGGDMHDWGSVSQWVADQSRVLDGGTIDQNYKELHKSLFRPLDKAAPKAKWVYLEGNHEFWLRTAAQINPNGRGFWELEKNVPKSIEIFPINKPFRASAHLAYVHGLVSGMGNTIYHARRAVDAYHVSVIYGHYHTFQTHMAVSPVDITQFYKGQAVGCLCNLNPYFMRNKPNAWVHGFNFTYMDQDGTFADNSILIVKNKFWANGRRYK